MKRYAISSTYFETLEEATERIKNLEEQGCLDKEARIFESSKIYIPFIEKTVILQTMKNASKGTIRKRR